MGSEFDSVFSGLAPIPGTTESVSLKRKSPEQGQRENLRVYETMPPQMLNSYGMAGFASMTHEKVWDELNKPLKTGAKYMTELEPRVVGINWFKCSLTT